jgi:gas vesicle protein|tara:strand:+ start:184 stop:390 length:207 start_codon:yes stop_codon:yes gene_type:complete
MGRVMDLSANWQKTNDMKDNLFSKLSEIKDEVQQVQDSIDFDDAEGLWNDVSDIKSDLQRLLYKLQKT